ncbi:hypothetical protein FIBSPDRAFT_897229 [Athelia psychrophila]|uniref:Uncharacterized protein n=1 Tax=Athelia psychrophila TaxID=1759441 RepID=A0A166CIA1_9AGAM|nr:hypothetical protein FIBSPDRAFT_897229 [Fibularhizoctonia sp. CBS 109695]
MPPSAVSASKGQQMSNDGDWLYLSLLRLCSIRGVVLETWGVGSWRRKGEKRRDTDDKLVNSKASTHTKGGRMNGRAGEAIYDKITDPRGDTVRLGVPHAKTPDVLVWIWTRWRRSGGLGGASEHVHALHRVAGHNGGVAEVFEIKGLYLEVPKLSTVKLVLISKCRSHRLLSTPKQRPISTSLAPPASSSRPTSSLDASRPKTPGTPGRRSPMPSLHRRLFSAPI